MKYKRMDIGAEFSDHERDALSHQAADELQITGQPVELGNRASAAQLVRHGEGGSQLWAPSQRIGAFTSFNLDEFARDLQDLVFGETRQRRALSLDAEAARALFLVGNAAVSAA